MKKKSSSSPQAKWYRFECWVLLSDELAEQATNFDITAKELLDRAKAIDDIQLHVPTKELEGVKTC